MYQAPANLWNQVWRAVPLKTEWGKIMFNLDVQELLEALEDVELMSAADWLRLVMRLKTDGTPSRKAREQQLPLFAA